MDRRDFKPAGLGCRAKTYEITNPKHPDFEPELPIGFKMFDSERAPTLWWTHEIAEYMEKRAEKFKANLAALTLERANKFVHNHERAPRKVTSVARKRRMRSKQVNKKMENA